MIGKGLKVHAKCPICGRFSSVNVEHATLMHSWQVYYCIKCNTKFKLPRGWKKQLQKRLRE
jgi:hypothetical protein